MTKQSTGTPGDCFTSFAMTAGFVFWFRQRSNMGFTLDSIISPEFKFYQPSHGYRINIDTVILYDFASKYAKGSVLEIGSASGIISILLSKHPGVSGVTGVEINRDLYLASLKNRQMHDSENGVRFMNADINAYKTLFRAQSYGALVTNPPFCREGTVKKGTRSGLESSHSDKYLTIENIFKAARYLLKPKGYLIMLFISRRIDEVFTCIRGFHIEVLRFVHRTKDRPSDVFLMLARKGGGKQLGILPPLIVHEAGGYSPEVTAMLNPD